MSNSQNDIVNENLEEMKIKSQKEYQEMLKEMSETKIPVKNLDKIAEMKASDYHTAFKKAREELTLEKIANIQSLILDESELDCLEENIYNILLKKYGHRKYT